MTAQNRTPEIEMKGIVKRFGDLVANDHVELSIAKGEIRALVGENGAGKTTLMRILFGLYRPDQGTIHIRGEEVDFRSPADAIRRRVGMVHQHFMLFEDLTVTENIIFGMEPQKWSFVDRKKAHDQVAALSRQYGFNLKPDALLGTLSVGERQRVEIVKTLYRGADVLILDEPTAVLTPQERDELFAVLRGLSEQGKTIILITHKLREVMALSHQATVMRRGKLVGTVKTEDTSIEELARMMVGREVFLQVEKPPVTAGEPVLTVEEITLYEDHKRELLKKVSFQVRSGEIVGIAGVAGNGQTELVDVLVGLRESDEGRIWFNGTEATRMNIHQRRDGGLSYIPEDRYRRGLAITASVAENLAMGFQAKAPISKRGIINRQGLEQWANGLVEEFDIRLNKVDEMAGNLSGGNLQKVVLAREFAHHTRLILADQPTRGVDIGATEFIHQQLVERRNAGDAVLLISADLNEIMSVSDRILVICGGEIVADITASEAEEEQLGLLMAGTMRLIGEC
jgi:ABC-type uncharacterized transport system ATPase subunit